MKTCLYCLKPLKSREFDSTSLHEKCYLEAFQLEKLEEFQNFSRKSSIESSTEESWVSSHFQGKFKKYSASLGGESYIIKTREAEYPELPDVEYICNKIGRTLELDVAKFFTVEVFGERAFITKNFISKGSKPENLVHIYHYINPKKQEYSCKTLLKIIEQETGNALELEKFVELCLFDSLIGNNDRHGRNLGFIIRADQIRLSPIYDNPSALGVEYGDILKATWNPTGKIATKHTDSPSAQDYSMEFMRLGYEDIVENFYLKVESNIKSIFKIIDQGFCSDLMKEALHRLIAKRFEELKNELKSK